MIGRFFQNFWKCIGMAFFCLLIFLVETCLLQLWNDWPMFFRFLVAWTGICGFSWILFMYDIKRASLPIGGLTALTFVWAFMVHNPGITAGAQRYHAIVNHDAQVAAITATLRTYTSEPCASLTFFKNDPLNPNTPISVAGYVEQPDGHLKCYNLSEHPDTPGIDRDGKQIQRVTPGAIVEKIHAQIAKEQEEQEEQAAALRRAQAATEEQRRIAQETPEPVATLEPPTPSPAPVAQATSQPNQYCARSQEISVAFKRDIRLDKVRHVTAKINRAVEDPSGIVLARLDTDVDLTIGQPEHGWVDVEVREIKGTAIRGRVEPFTVSPHEHRERVELVPGVYMGAMITVQDGYLLTQGSYSLRMREPICVPVASVRR